MVATNPNCSNQVVRPGVLHVTDFDRLMQVFASWEGTFEQLSCGRFESTLQMAIGRMFHAHLATANQAIRVRGRERAGVHTFTLVLPESACCTWQGRHLDAGSLVVRSGDVGVDHQTSKRAINLSMVVSDDVLHHAVRALTGADPASVSWLAVKPSPAQFRRLESRIRHFFQGGTATIGSLESHQLEQSCLAAAVEVAVPRTESRRIDIPSRSRTALVHRAEEFMRARLRSPIGEIDLCAELDVSGRTLRLAFRERFGLGPMAYYQTLRLNAARSVLKSADLETASVARIGREFGFCHPGKFAGYYRRLFGILPSRIVPQD